jgi:hypothetical protein
VSTVLRSPPRRLRRPAPEGSRPLELGADWPPDGWQLVDPSLSDRMVERADYGLLRAADSMARWITRREFLRRAGELGLVAGLATTRVVWGKDVAQAGHVRCYQCGNACGPSPPCPTSRCTSGGDCNAALSGMRYRVHDGWACTNTSGQCWIANCCNPPSGHCETQQAKKQCCDCCDSGSPNNCTSPCTNKYKCICEKGLGCP